MAEKELIIRFNTERDAWETAVVWRGGTISRILTIDFPWRVVARWTRRQAYYPIRVLEAK